MKFIIKKSPFEGLGNIFLFSYFFNIMITENFRLIFIILYMHIYYILIFIMCIILYLLYFIILYYHIPFVYKKHLKILNLDYSVSYLLHIPKLA